MMIHVFLSRIKVKLISREVTASQTWLQDQSGFHPKVSDSQMYEPAKSGCQEKMDCQPKSAASQNWLMVKNEWQPKKARPKWPLS